MSTEQYFTVQDYKQENEVKTTSEKVLKKEEIFSFQDCYISDENFPTILKLNEKVVSPSVFISPDTLVVKMNGTLRYYPIKKYLFRDKFYITLKETPIELEIPHSAKTQDVLDMINRSPMFLVDFFETDPVKEYPLKRC